MIICFYGFNCITLYYLIIKSNMTKVVYPIRLAPETIEQLEKDAELENRKPRNHAANIIEMYFKNKQLPKK